MSQSWIWQVVMQLRHNDSDSDFNAAHSGAVLFLCVWRLEIYIYTHMSFSQATARIKLSFCHIITSSALLLLTHRSRLQPSGRMDNPGCCCSLCQTKIEAATQAKKTTCICVRRLAFSEEIHFSHISTAPLCLYLIHCVNSLVSTKIVWPCVLLLPLVSPLLSQTVKLQAFDCKEKSIHRINSHRIKQESRDTLRGRVFLGNLKRRAALQHK